MNTRLIYWGLVGGLVATTAGCGGNDSAYVAALRAAVAESDVTLAESIAIAEAGQAVAYQGLLDVDDARFEIHSNATDGAYESHINYLGEIIAETASAPQGCASGITASQAVAIAEADQGGEAVAVELEMEADDGDIPCTYEVQVLTPDLLMEVEVGPDGSILEVEESDEDGSADDDD